MSGIEKSMDKMLDICYEIRVGQLEEENQKREALSDIVKSAKFVAQELSHNGDKVRKAMNLHKELIETLSKESKNEN
jgi:hypothetical protein